VINVQLEVAQAALHQDPERALDSLRKAQSLTQEGLADVRRSIAALGRSPTEDRPLPEVLSALLEECQASGLSIMLGMAMVLLGGCWYPIELYPEAARTAVQVLPTTGAM
jgi:signal transduction histidine kinase